MKIGILTWHQAINHGAVLQTYASCKMLEKLGETPIVLEYDRVMDEKIHKGKRLIRRIKNFSPAKLLWYRNVKRIYKTKSYNFARFRQDYLPLGKKYNEEKNIDIVYIGSDMVFDISQGYNEFMYGIGVPCQNIFSYAASFGYSTLQSIKQSGHFNEIRDGISKFKAIGYRDENTRLICNELVQNIALVETIDPVLCYGFEKEYNEWDSKKWKNKKYLLVYAYDSTMNDSETVKVIREYANNNGLEIVSCGYYHKWCDICVPASPIELIELFKYASCIITDTFHGTVFSALFHKQFVSIIRNNGFKVKHLLEQTQLERRIVTNKDLVDILAEEIDYSFFDEWIASQRNKSYEFIESNMR